MFEIWEFKLGSNERDKKENGMEKIFNKMIGGAFMSKKNEKNNNKNSQNNKNNQNKNNNERSNNNNCR